MNDHHVSIDKLTKKLAVMSKLNPSVFLKAYKNVWLWN